ncbi:MAG: hypothetical protein ABI200_08100, partial [Gaiellales bacterium]
DALASPFLGRDAVIQLHQGALPHKLRGLLLGDRLITDHDPAAGAAKAFRDILKHATEATTAVE